jgi:hypothetical protein
VLPGRPDATGNIYFGSSFDALHALPQLQVEAGKPGSLDEIKREGKPMLSRLFNS